MKAATGNSDGVRTRIKISIHAAREGGDFAGALMTVVQRGISIHAAREGGDGGNV